MFLIKYLGLTRDGDATLIHEQAYEEGLLDKPYFSIYFKKCTNQQTQCQDGGVVKIGDEDLRNCEPVRGKYLEQELKLVLIFGLGTSIFERSSLAISGRRIERWQLPS